MNNYIIYTDSACDVSTSLLREWRVCVSSLSFRFDHEDREYTNEEMPISEFYEKMREGFRAKTSAVMCPCFRQNLKSCCKLVLISCTLDLRPLSVQHTIQRKWQ